MEVHHHPEVEKKGFKEYIFEGLMIFLAVTMGFFAESYREYLGDRGKEHEYMRNMVEDLKKDSSVLHKYIYDAIPKQQKWLDSAIYLLKEENSGNRKDRELYQAIFMATAWNTDFHPTERTLTQLRAEGFRLLKNYNTNVAVDDYESILKYSVAYNTRLETFESQIDESLSDFANKNITEFVATNQWTHGYFYDLKLSEIPANANFVTYNQGTFDNYSHNLQRYSFDLTGRKVNDRLLLYHFLIPLIKTIKKEYRLE